MRRRRRGSDLYQVDFVAALFSGFLLVWLSGISEAEFPEDASPPLSFYELNARAYFSPQAGGSVKWSAVLPTPSVTEGCVHPNVIQLAASSLIQSLRACESALTRKLNRPGDVAKDYYAAIESDLYRPTHVHDPIVSFGTTIEIFSRSNGKDSHAKFWGIALKSVSDPNAIGVADDQAVSIGTVPSPNWPEGKLYAHISHPFKFDSALISIPELTGPLPAPPASARLLNFYFLGLDGHIVWQGYEQLPQQLELVVTLSPSTGGGCYRASVAPNDEGDKELLPC